MIRTARLNKTLRSRQLLAALLSFIVLCAMALFSAGAGANDDDPPGRVGRVTESQGQSWLYDADAGEWVALQRNRPLTTGSRIAVDGSGRLELRVGSTTVRLAGGSEIELRRLDDERIDLALLNGSAALRVRSQDVSREVELSTRAGRFAPRGAGHFRIDHRDDTSVATVWNGELHFENDDSALDIASGRSAEFWREAGATHYSWAETQTDEFADWVVRANREDDRSGAVTRYVSPEMTGYEDLERNGRWETHAEYGPLWTPTTVVAGWAPYRYGHWAWIRPWGWTWVDDAPWGFAPFHYGRWVTVGGRWCWTPGRYVARPVYAPALVAWIGGSHGGVHVGVGAPVVGWVPLAPREPYYPYYGHRGRYWKAVNSAHIHLYPQNTPSTAPTRAIMYVNQRVPGGVSAVPSAAIAARRPIAPAIAQVDPAIQNNLSNQAWRPHVAPPGLARTIAVPSGRAAVPAPTAPPAGTGAPPGVRPPPGVAQPPVAAVPREPHSERIPRPVRPPPVTAQTAPQVQGQPAPQAQGQPAPQAAPPVQPRRIEPGDWPGARREMPGRNNATPPGAPPPAAAATPPVRRAPIPGPEVHNVPPPQPEARMPVPRAPMPAQPPEPAPRAAMPAPVPVPRMAPPPPAPRVAVPMPPQQREMQREVQRDQRDHQRDMQRGREPEARVRAPESRGSTRSQ